MGMPKFIGGRSAEKGGTRTLEVPSFLTEAQRERIRADVDALVAKNIAAARRGLNQPTPSFEPPVVFHPMTVFRATREALAGASGKRFGR